MKKVVMPAKGKKKVTKKPSKSAGMNSMMGSMPMAKKGMSVKKKGMC